MCKSNSGHFTSTNGAKRHLIKILKRDGKKVNENEVVFATTDHMNRILWLEIGSEKSGLTHIVKKHKNEFKNFGIEMTQIKKVIKNTIKNKEPLNTYYDLSKNKIRLNRVYELKNNVFIHISVGTNGFIVSAFPTTSERYLKIKGVDKNGKQIK